MARRQKKTGIARKDWLLLIGSVAVSLVLALALIRWFAPSLLGIRDDLQIVQVSKKLPPFFEGVFRKEDYSSKDVILSDPYTRIRAKPLIPAANGLGPHDILGFRSRGIPNVVDILTIGDSQTYGNNVPLEENWPSQLARYWPTKTPVVYNMSVGGWGAVQYLDMFRHATAFQPRLVVVAFYSGNDAVETFTLAYAVDRFDSLRPDPRLSNADLMPGVKFPPPPEELWAVKFKDGSGTTFSPRLRLAANHSDYAGVRAGYTIMADVAQRIVNLARPNGIKVVFTIIPTKELVYAKRLQSEGIQRREDYATLVRMEQDNIATLANAIREIAGAEYVDLVDALQAAALRPALLYPSNENGHPVATGYKVIAGAIASAVKEKNMLPAAVLGLVGLEVSSGQYRLLLVDADGVWDFASEQVVRANGWNSGKARLVRQRDIDGLPYRGVISHAEPGRYGPAVVRSR